METEFVLDAIFPGVWVSWNPPKSSEGVALYTYVMIFLRLFTLLLKSDNFSLPSLAMANS